jgi:hypothetical protein
MRSSTDRILTTHVGAENVIAGADRGFGSRIHP